MNKKSSGWMVLALFALIPVFMIAAGMALALGLATTTTRQVTIGPEDAFSNPEYHVRLAETRGDSEPNELSSATKKQNHSEKDGSNGATPPAAEEKKKNHGNESGQDSEKSKPTGEKAAGDQADDSEKLTTRSAKSKKSVFTAPETTRSNAKPLWVINETERSQSKGRRVLVETRIESPENVEAEIDKLAMVAAEDYIRNKFGNTCADRVKVDLEHVQTRLITRRHREILTRERIEALFDNDSSLSTLDYEYGYAELQFDKDFDSLIYSRWQRQKRSSRLIQILLVCGSVFTLMVIGFSFFSTDRATRGMYTVRLQLGTLLLLVVAGLVIWFAVSSFQWL